LSKYKIETTRYESNFSKQWIKTTNVKDFIGKYDMNNMNIKLLDYLENLGFQSDASSKKKVHEDQRYVIPYGTLNKDNPAYAKLESLVAGFVEAYIELLNNEGFSKTLWQEKFKLYSFSAATRSSGYHYPHMHSGAMFVITYYVKIPPESKTDLLFGCQVGTDQDYFYDSIFSFGRPKVGAMVIFPAFYAHATTRQESSDLRVNIGFDVQPI
jgi:hypothetical protein